MPSTDLEGRLARIRKLLVKAEDLAVTPQEAEAYTAKATELLAAYGIDRALLAEAEPTSDLPGDLVVEMVAPYARDKANLLWAVAAPLRCRGVLRTGLARVAVGGRVDKQLSMHVFGFSSDLERLELLFTSLLVQLTNGLVATPVPNGEHAAAYRRTWIAGFTAAVRHRLQRAEQRAASDGAQAAPASGRSVALVLADRTAVVERELRAAYPASRPTPGRRLSGWGYAGGYAAGERADLGGARLSRTGGGRRAVGRAPEERG